MREKNWKKCTKFFFHIIVVSVDIVGADMEDGCLEKQSAPRGATDGQLETINFGSVIDHPAQIDSWDEIPKWEGSEKNALIWKNEFPPND